MRCCPLVVDISRPLQASSTKVGKCDAWDTTEYDCKRRTKLILSRTEVKCQCLILLFCADGWREADCRCHPEHIRYAQCKLREGLARGAERCFATLSMTK